MQRRVLDRLELEITRNGADYGAINIDFEHGGQEVAGIDQTVGLGIVERDGESGFATTVNHGGNLASTTNCAGGPLATRRARRSLDLLHSGHVFDPSRNETAARHQAKGGSAP